ncbi:MAG: ExbD/TolR family protein [Betaproteobacteria bacterium]
MSQIRWGTRALYGASDEHEPLAAINTTPLVDVMLVLLIIFLITVPVATASMSVALPQESTELRQVVPKTLHVSVDRQGRLFLAQTPVKDGAELTRALQAMNEPDRPIHLVADKDAPYGQIEPALRALRSAGMRRVSFVTEPVLP